MIAPSFTVLVVIAAFSPSPSHSVDVAVAQAGLSVVRNTFRTHDGLVVVVAPLASTVDEENARETLLGALTAADVRGGVFVVVQDPDGVLRPLGHERGSSPSSPAGADPSAPSPSSDAAAKRQHVPRRHLPDAQGKKAAPTPT